MNPLILLIIFAILFISSIIGLIIGIIKLKQANKMFSKYKDENPKPNYFGDKIYAELQKKSLSFLALTVCMPIVIIFLLSFLIYYINKYKF
jgi:hypothetical protein